MVKQMLLSQLRLLRHFFTQVYSSTPAEFNRPDWLSPMKTPQYPFNDDPITITEIQVIKLTKSTSSPSPRQGRS